MAGGDAVTAFPVLENASCWWLTTQSWRCLHAVPAGDLAWADLCEAIEEGEYVLRTTKCGMPYGLTYPGVMSRFSLPRCALCCRKLGIGRGAGSPINEAAIAAANERLKKEGA